MDLLLIVLAILLFAIGIGFFVFGLLLAVLKVALMR